MAIGKARVVSKPSKRKIIRKADRKYKWSKCAIQKRMGITVVRAAQE